MSGLVHGGPAVVVLGELRGACGFVGQNNLFVKYRVVCRNDNWRVSHGDDNGQTWVADRELVRTGFCLDT